MSLVFLFLRFVPFFYLCANNVVLMSYYVECSYMRCMFVIFAHCSLLLHCLYVYLSSLPAAVLLCGE